MPGWEGNWRRTLQAIACRTGHYFTSCRLQDGTLLYKLSLAIRDTTIQAVACITRRHFTSLALWDGTVAGMRGTGGSGGGFYYALTTRNTGRIVVGWVGRKC